MGQGIGAGIISRWGQATRNAQGGGGRGKLVCSPCRGWLIGHRLGFGISAYGMRSSLCNGGGLRCLPLCAFSVASPIPTPHPINQKAMARRISGESAIRSGHGGGADRERDNMRASYQHHGDGERRESDRRTEGQRTPPRTDHRLAQRTPTPRVSAPPFACGQHGAGENTPSQKFSMF